MSTVNPEELSRLLGERGPALVLYAQQWCGNPEDVVQEAFLELAQQPEAPDNAVGWLYRVVRHRALNSARSTVRRRRRESAAALPADSWFEPDVMGQMEAGEATEALRQLPVAQREVIVARLWGGLSFPQIAELVGTSISTAYRRYHAGIVALRERLGVSCLESESQPNRPVPHPTASATGRGPG